MLSKKSLGKELATLRTFRTHHAELEQFSTPSHIAESLLWTAHMQRDIKGKHVVDLGAGTGILGIGCLFLGARHVVFVEKDPDAIEVLDENLDDFMYTNYEILESDIGHVRRHADTVVMNPPFGAVNEHADRRFLLKALELAPHVYSIHNANSRNFLQAFSRDENCRLDIIAEQQIYLPNVHEFHTKTRAQISVVLIRLSWRS